LSEQVRRPRDSAERVSSQLSRETRARRLLQTPLILGAAPAGCGSCLWKASPCRHWEVLCLPGGLSSSWTRRPPSALLSAWLCPLPAPRWELQRREALRMGVLCPCSRPCAEHRAAGGAQRARPLPRAPDFPGPRSAPRVQGQPRGACPEPG